MNNDWIKEFDENGAIQELSEDYPEIHSYLKDFIQSLLDKQKQEERNRITQICEEVRDECRESDDQWDKGDECKRIKNKLTNT